MKMRRITALVACSAYMLSACAAGTPEPIAPATPQAVVEPPSVTGTEHTLEAGSGWPEGTESLRPVIFRVTVSEDMEATLLSNGEGHLFIESVEEFTLAKLIFRNGERAVYEMPAGGLIIRGIGESFTCRNALFYTPYDKRRDTEIDITISGGKDELNINLENRKGTVRGTTVRSNFICRSSARWAAWDEERGTQVAAADARKKALKVLKYLVLVPLYAIGSLRW